MKRAVAWIAGLVSIAALGRWLARRARRDERTPGPVGGDPGGDPADALRQQLDAARGTETPPPAPTASGIDERRRDVHTRAHETIDAMRESGL